MPTISMFYGIIIRMFFEEHAPPHFHAQYGEYKAAINIDTLEIMEGTLPRRALNLVLGLGGITSRRIVERLG